jgi:hypothetical protein
LALVGFEVMDAVPKRIGLRTNLPTIYESCWIFLIDIIHV